MPLSGVRIGGPFVNVTYDFLKMRGLIAFCCNSIPLATRMFLSQNGLRVNCVLIAQSLR